jgi:hypothetical protein
MTTKAADDFESIARRLKELESERKLAVTGRAPVVFTGFPTGKTGTTLSAGPTETSGTNLPIWGSFGNPPRDEDGE